MSDTAEVEAPDEQIETIAPDERPLLGREFAETKLELDGRNVYLRCVPWDVTAIVQDPPDFMPYEESFARGAFSGAMRDPQRVYLEFEHFHPGLSGVIGRGVELEDRSDALYGHFRMLKTQDGDKALELIADGVLKGASVFFQPQKNARTARGVRRLKAKLERVAVAPTGAYPGAQILAVRSAVEFEEDEPDAPQFERIPPLDPDLIGALSDKGITLPDRLK